MIWKGELSLVIEAMDIGTDRLKFEVKIFVTTIDVVDVGNFSFTLGDECSDDHGRAGADVVAGNGHAS